jgi:hypothetical protein
MDAFSKLLIIGLSGMHDPVVLFHVVVQVWSFQGTSLCLSSCQIKLECTPTSGGCSQFQSKFLYSDFHGYQLWW